MRIGLLQNNFSAQIKD